VAAERTEQLIADVLRGAGHRDGVVHHELLELGEEGAVAVVVERLELLLGDAGLTGLG
jgi:hypothetical protein